MLKNVNVQTIVKRGVDLLTLRHNLPVEQDQRVRYVDTDGFWSGWRHQLRYQKPQGGVSAPHLEFYDSLDEPILMS